MLENVQEKARENKICFDSYQDRGIQVSLAIQHNTYFIELKNTATVYSWIEPQCQSLLCVWII